MVITRPVGRLNVEDLKKQIHPICEFWFQNIDSGEPNFRRSEVWAFELNSELGPALQFSNSSNKNLEGGVGR